jgi:transcriptional antiterminator RfaH
MELSVSAMLRAKGYDEFLPLRRSSSQTAAEPLFAGYVFCRLVPHVSGRFVTTPGVIRVVSFGGKPAPIDTEEIVALQLVDKAKWPISAHEEFRVGDKVRVDKGPLRGVSGVLMSIRGQYRLLISVQILMRTVSVEVRPEWVVNLDAPNCGINQNRGLIPAMIRDQAVSSHPRTDQQSSEMV